MGSFERSLFSAAAYFSIFQYPLTAFELSKLAYFGKEKITPTQDISFLDIIQTLSHPPLSQLFESQDGFYFLQGENETVPLRKFRYTLAQRKYRKALCAVRLLSFVPFVRFIGICNSLSYSNSSESSDIDLFIIASAGKIWWCRFFVASILKLLRLRPGPRNIKDRICASFFISERHLDISDLKFGENDIYLDYWITQLYPVYNTTKCYERFLQANSWLQKIFPLFLPISPVFRREIREQGFWSVLYFGKYVLERVLSLGIFSCAGGWVKNFQFRALPKNLKELLNRDTRVVMNDEVLKFHEKDRREEYWGRWGELFVIPAPQSGGDPDRPHNV